MFETLTIDELKSLMAALVTEDHGFSSNRMAKALNGTSDHAMWHRYSDMAEEILSIYTEAGKLLVSRYEAAPGEDEVLPEDGPPYRCVKCNAELIPTVNDYGRARMMHAPETLATCPPGPGGWYRDRQDEEVPA